MKSWPKKILVQKVFGPEQSCFSKIWNKRNFGYKKIPNQDNRTNVARTNVTGTAVLCEIWSQKSSNKVWSKLIIFYVQYLRSLQKSFGQLPFTPIKKYLYGKILGFWLFETGWTENAIEVLFPKLEKWRESFWNFGWRRILQITQVL